MARSISDIKSAMVTSLQGNETLNAALTSPSLTAIYNLWMYIAAACINLLEQFQDLFISDVTTEISNKECFNQQWLTNAILNWQYGYTVAVQSNWTLSYPTNDDSAKLVKRMTLIPGPTYGASEIRVSKGTNPPISLTAGEKTSLTTYLTSILPPGMNTPTVNTAECDEMTVILNVYHDPIYYQTIQNDVFTALANYFNNPNNGVIYVMDMITALNSVNGMVRFDLIEVAARAHGDPYSSAVIVYSHVDGVNIGGNVPGEWETANGAAIQETTATHTWSDTIKFYAVNA